MNPLVYFSSSSENTHRFVEKLGLPAIRIPIAGARSKLLMEQPYILIVPSYGGGSAVGAVPIRDPLSTFRKTVHTCAASSPPGTPTSAQRTASPATSSPKMPCAFLYRFELLGTAQDVENVRQGVTAFWQRQN